MQTHQHCISKACYNNKTVMPANYNHDSANLVYLLHCQKCPEAQYIEETGRNFIYQFYNHTHSIRHKKPFPLPLHFDADNHSINDLKLCLLKGNFRDTNNRKLIEIQLFISYKTNKFCINKDISFVSRHDTFKHKG